MIRACFVSLTPLLLLRALFLFSVSWRQDSKWHVDVQAICIKTRGAALWTNKSLAGEALFHLGIPVSARRDSPVCRPFFSWWWCPEPSGLSQMSPWARGQSRDSCRSISRETGARPCWSGTGHSSQTCTSANRGQVQKKIHITYWISCPRTASLVLGPHLVQQDPHLLGQVLQGFCLHAGQQVDKGQEVCHRPVLNDTVDVVLLRSPRARRVPCLLDLVHLLLRETLLFEWWASFLLFQLIQSLRGVDDVLYVHVGQQQFYSSVIFVIHVDSWLVSLTLK